VERVTRYARYRENIHTTSVGTRLMKVDTVLRESGENKPSRAANVVLTR
jgi:hypothetical protein